MIQLDKQTREQYMEVVVSALREDNIDQFRPLFLALHPTDQLELYLLLNEEERQLLYTFLSPGEMAEVFGGLNFRHQEQFIAEMADAYIADMFNEMFTDDIVAFLSKKEDVIQEQILQYMEQGKAKKIRSILAYKPETAGAVMTKELIRISSEDTVDGVLKQMREKAPDAEIVYYLYVVDVEGRLVGVVSLRDLLVAKPEEKIADLMLSRVVSVPDHLDQEEVGAVIQKYDLFAVPVVSSENHLLGIVTVDDMMDILEMEMTEDFGEISATKGATDIDLGAFTAARKRSPWIITLMFFGLITGGVIGRFEETLESVVLLAVFIPMIMDSAGNVGTQSLAIAVRGLALGTVEKQRSFKMILRELRIGVMIGLICMVVITALVYLFYGHLVLGLIVGVSILATLSLSAMIGAIVPLIVNRMNIDPAVASGPFITTLNDIIGLLIYFSIATTLIDFL